MKKVAIASIVVFHLALIVCPAPVLALTIDLDAAFSNYDPGDLRYGLDYGTVTLTEGYFNSDLYTDVQFDVDVRTTAGGAGGADADLDDFFFNINPNFSLLSITGNDVVSYNIDFSASDNTHKADGDGYFDVFVNFGSGTPILQKTAFYVSLANTNLIVENFADGTAATQSVGGNKGSFTVAAHLQSTLPAPPGSEYVGGNPSIPDATTVFLLGSACLIGFVRFRRNFKK